jgi:hypothetical protein
VTSTPHPCDPMPENEKLGTAAEYLATQVAGKKADAIRPALGPAAARLAGAVRSAIRSMIRKAGLVAVRSAAGKADTGGTTEGER